MGPRRQGGVPEGCGRWCCGPHWGSGFGGNAESLQELPRVSVGRHGPDQWTGLLSAYTRACGAQHTQRWASLPPPASRLAPVVPQPGSLGGCGLGAPPLARWAGRMLAWFLVGYVGGRGAGAGKTALRRRVCSKGTWLTALAWRQDEWANPRLHTASFVGGNGASCPWAVLVRALSCGNALVPACPLRRGLGARGLGLSGRPGSPCPATDCIQRRGLQALPRGRVRRL